MIEFAKSVISISFDWNDNYSNWRLEDLSDSIITGNKMLEKYKLPSYLITDVFELEKMSSELRNLYKLEAVSDSDARKALLLGDEIYFDNDIYSFDTEIAYQDQLSFLKDSIKSWASNQDTLYLDDEWSVNEDKILDNLLSSRNGLGDRWNFVIYDDCIELSDGSFLYGIKYKDNKSLSKLIDFLEYNLDDNIYLGELSKLLSCKEIQLLDKLYEFLSDIEEAFEFGNINISDVIFILDNILILSNFEIDRVKDTILSLHPEWRLSFTELLKLSIDI
jgi:hypothetical protein